MFFRAFFLSASVLGLLSLARPPPRVAVAQGRLRGTWFTTRAGRKVPSFLGIPYAAPPVGNLRFNIPQEPKPWRGEFLASREGPECPQRSFLAGYPLVSETTGSEDCLYLNVFTPTLTPRAPLAVVVFIHGGAWELGSKNSLFYGPQFLLDEDVILVTINYRLGVLGFLSLEDPILAGNLGLKDQRAALRWVRGNIANFGGDPNKVTLFGESAGAASVHYHMIFNAHEGLFRAGIMNSGSARARWTYQRPGGQRHLVRALLSLSRCPEEPQPLLDCLRRLPTSFFQHFQHNLKEGEFGVHRKATWRIMTEPECVKDRLVSGDPWQYNTSLPILAGTNQLEGLWGINDVEKDKSDKMFLTMDTDYANLWPYIMYFEDRARDPRAVAEALRRFYFQDSPIDRQHLLQFADLVSDAIHIYDVVESVRANLHRTYFYQLNYVGANSIVRLLGSRENYGVSHVDDMFFLFPMGGRLLRNFTASDTKVSRVMVNMWTNFVKYLDPTPGGRPLAWRPVSSSNLEFLNIDQHGLHMDSNFLKQRMDFWRTLPIQDKPPEDPPRCQKRRTF